MSQLSIVELTNTLPKQIKGKVTQSMVDTVNNLADPEFREHYRDNLVSYGSVLDKGKFKIEQYFDAVKYVSYKILGDNIITAYKKTFPTKYANFKAQGVLDKDIASYASAYNKNKLVNLIWEQSSIPFHVINQDIRQKALMTQVELMETAKSEKVRSDAANSVLTHLKPPETNKMELEISHKEDSHINDLRKAVQELSARQGLAIKSGILNAKEVAHSPLVIDNVDGSIIE